MKIKNKVIAAALAVAAIAGSFSVSPVYGKMAESARPSTNVVYVDGVKANVAAYKINGNNYFKLRDIAAIVNGSEKQFEVEWDGANRRIDLTSGEPYTSVGGELGTIGSGTKSANPSNDVIYKDDVKMDYTGYKIGGNNFYKLRDVCQSFDIGVEYDNATQRVDILTDESYVEEGAEQPTPEEPDENEGKEYRNGFWIDGVVTDDSGKEIAIIIGGNQYSDGDEGTVDDRDFFIDRSTVSGRLIPCEIAKQPSESKPVDPDPDDVEPEKRIPEAGQYNEVYLQQMEDSGEEIVTVTVKYKLWDNREQLILKHVPAKMYVYTLGYNELLHGYYDYYPCMAFMSDGSGEGSFTFKMTRSDYNTTMSGTRVFYVRLASDLISRLSRTVSCITFLTAQRPLDENRGVFFY